MLNRETARKQYSLPNNMMHGLREMKTVGIRYYAYLFCDIITQIVIPFLLVLIPAEVVRMFQEKRNLQDSLIMIALWIFGILIMNLIRTFTHQKIENMAAILTDTQYWRKLNREMLSCDLLKVESSQERDMLNEVMNALYGSDGMGNYSGVIGLYLYSIALLVNIGGFLLYGAIAGSLHPMLLAVLFITSIINCFAQARAINYEFTHMKAFWENSDRFWYIKNESINTEKAKDIRMYHLIRWFQKALHHNTEEASSIYDDVMQHHFYADSIVRFTSILRDGFAYLFLIMQLADGVMDVSMFIIYIGIVAGFGNWITKIVESYTYLKKISYGISMYRSYVKEEISDTDTKPQPVPQDCHKITFSDVSFGYEPEHLIFDHFSLQIHAGEKLALVGVNGAGKTTLTKMLCGLYPLKHGQISVNDIDIATMDKDAYFRAISILFQDVHVLPFSIAKNVSCAWNDEEQQWLKEMYQGQEICHAFDQVDRSEIHMNEYDEEKIIRCLKQVNLWEKVSQLPNGIHTVLTQILDHEGVNLSGGQIQRLMLARALYKEAPILILDEPTSALDPIAESELYQEYAKLCENKISIFISHRLSSTRFCDRILFLENGKIVEQGTHDELMALHGHYAEMYQIQAHYYQKEVEKHEAGI